MPDLRPATAQDFDFLWALHCASMRAYVDQTWGWNDADQRRRFEEHFDPARRQIILVQRRPVGVLSIDLRPNELFLELIELLPEYQRQGIGTRLIQSLQAQASSKRIPLTLTVLKVNPARALYERLGFRQVAEDDVHFYMTWSPHPS